MLKIEQLFDKTHLMPTIPKVVQELIDSFSNEEIDVESIARKLGVDQVLTAKVLRLANSSYYGLQRKIGSVDEAVVVMGLNSLRTLVIATGVTGAFAPITGFDRTRFWRHSLVVAAYARWLAKKCGLNSEIAFTAGLMHAIGEVLIHLAMPNESEDIDRRASRGERRIDIERAAFGFSNCEVGAELARRWCFPAEIQAAILHYDAPLALKPAPPYAAVVHIATYLAVAQQANVASEAQMAEYPLEVGAAIGLDATKAIVDLPSIGDISAGLDAFLGA